MQLLEKPWWKLTKLMSVVLALLLIGTLPFLDNWSHVGGFAFGEHVSLKCCVSGFFVFFYLSLELKLSWLHENLFSHLSWWLGVVSGIVFLPYITFGEWDVARKRLLFLICFPLLIAMFVAAFVTFYQIQNTEFCSWCHYLNCIPYSSSLSCWRKIILYFNCFPFVLIDYSADTTIAFSLTLLITIEKKIVLLFLGFLWFLTLMVHYIQVLTVLYLTQPNFKRQ